VHQLEHAFQASAFARQFLRLLAVLPSLGIFEFALQLA
jgi:hypothetical protein